VTFPKIENQPAGVKSVPLRAISDSGLPVAYYVVAGPAEVEGGVFEIHPDSAAREIPGESDGGWRGNTEVPANLNGKRLSHARENFS